MAVQATVAMLSSASSDASGQRRRHSLANSDGIEEEEEEEEVVFVAGGGAEVNSAGGITNASRATGSRKGRAASKLLGFSFPVPASAATAGGKSARGARGSDPSDGEGGGSDSDNGSWHTATPSAVTIAPKGGTHRGRRAEPVGQIPPSSAAAGPSGTASVLAEKLIDMRQRAEKWKARCAQLGDQLATLGGSLAAKVRQGRT